MTDVGGIVEGTVAVARTSIRLGVLSAGPEDGPPVILLHGFPDAAFGWKAQIAALAAAGHRVLAPDQRGYGTSDKPPGVGSYRIDRLADDVLGLADTLGLGRFSVVGHDWGGVVAWWLALCAADRLERLAILNAPFPDGLLRYALTHPTQMMRSAYALFFQLPGLPERSLAAHDHALAVRALKASSRPDIFTAGDLARYRAGWSQPGAWTAMLNWYRALPHRPPLPAQRVRVPTLILWGGRDRFLERGLAESAAHRCDDARLVVIEEAGHWIQREEAGRVNAALIDVLNHPAPGP